MSVYFHVVDVKTRSDGEKLVLSSYVLSIILIMLMLINTHQGVLMKDMSFQHPFVF